MLGAGDIGTDRALAFLAGDGAMARLIRGHDWAATPLGSPATWPAALKTVVRLMLATGHPAMLFWGPQYRVLYNDAYSLSLGPQKHPVMLGQPGRDHWQETWPVIGPQIEMVMRGEGATWHENQLVPIIRNGRLEDVYWTYSYGPIDDETAPNGVGGVLVLCSETTETVFAARRVEDERERLTALFEQAPSFMAMLTGPDHVVERTNRAYMALIGHRDVIGVPIHRALPDAVEQGFVALLDEVYASGVPYTASGVTYAMQAEPGGPVDPRVVDFVFAPVTDGAGTVTGILVEGYDVTARARADAALRDSEERFRSVAEAMPGFVWTATAAGALDYTSSRWLDYSGDSGDQGLQSGWADYVHPDDRGEAIARWQAAVATGQVYEAEFRLRRHDGAYRWWLVRAVPMHGDDGGVLRWIGSAADLHDRRQAEERLRISEAHYRTMADALPQLVWTCLPDGQCNFLGRQWADYTGIASHAQLGLDWLDRVIHPDDRERTYDHWMGAVRGEHPYDIEYRIRRHDGVYHWFKTRGTQLLGSDGSIVLWFGTCTDVTDVIEAREVLARAEAELEIKVGERTAELEAAQEALRQSQKLEAMGQLTGGVAHDFNNLLTPILGNLDLLQRRGVGGEREARMIAGALTSAERAKTLVQRLLAFARRQPLQPQAVDLAALVRGMIDLIRSTIGSRVALDIDIDAGLPPALADANQLEMALLNLAVNARDAMPDGGRLTISARAQHTDDMSLGLAVGGYIRLSIDDTGTGMTPETLARAIEPFFSTKGIGKGTGLGLSMVHGLAAQLGGQLEIASVVGEGTRIALLLPVSDTPVAARPRDAALDRPNAATTALLVEDEELVRMSSADMLTDLGYRVIEAASGDEALALVKAGAEFDVLVTDHLMPGMTGVELIGEMRRLKPEISVLLVSGYAEAAPVPVEVP